MQNQTRQPELLPNRDAHQSSKSTGARVDWDFTQQMSADSGSACLAACFRADAEVSDNLKCHLAEMLIKSLKKKGPTKSGFDQVNMWLRWFLC